MIVKRFTNLIQRAISEVFRRRERIEVDEIKRIDPDKISISINTSVETLGVSSLDELTECDRQIVAEMVCEDFGMCLINDIETEEELRRYIQRNADPNYNRNEMETIYDF